MKRITKIMTLVLLICLIAPLMLHAKAKKAAVSSAPDKPTTFKMSKTLPGGINVDFSLVTLAQYKADVNAVFDYTFKETARIADMFNGANPNSDLSKLAAEAGKGPVKVSKETLVLATHAKEVADWTRGAFEPVRGPGTYKDMKINKDASTIYLAKQGLSLELKEILEGFIADLFIRAAYHANLEDALVRVGKVQRSMGQDSFGPWHMTISGTGDKLAKKGMTITISNYSAATVGGDTSAPTIDPRNGKPVNTPLYSVTVLSKMAATAQGVASAIYIAGPFEGESVIKSLGIRAIFAYNDGRIEKIGKW